MTLWWSVHQHNLNSTYVLNFPNFSVNCIITLCSLVNLKQIISSNDSVIEARFDFNVGGIKDYFRLNTDNIN